MKINDNQEIFMEVRFGDLKPGDTFAIERESGYVYGIKTIIKTIRGSITNLSIDFKDGSILWLYPDDLVIPVEIIGDAKWPDKVIRRK